MSETKIREAIRFAEEYGYREWLGAAEELNELVREYRTTKERAEAAEQRTARLVNSFARFFFLAKEGDIETLEAEMNAAGSRALTSQMKETE